MERIGRHTDSMWEYVQYSQQVFLKNLMNETKVEFDLQPNVLDMPLRRINDVLMHQVNLGLTKAFEVYRKELEKKLQKAIDLEINTHFASSMPIADHFAKLVLT